MSASIAADPGAAVRHGLLRSRERCHRNGISIDTILLDGGHQGALVNAASARPTADEGIAAIGDDTEYTIDGLARVGDTTVRSIRVYHERGVLPPPEVRGRIGYYTPEHLNRLRTISRLLSRGVKLNGIKELLEALDRGEGLADVLGVVDEPTDTPTDSADASIPQVSDSRDKLLGLLRSTGVHPDRAAAERERFETDSARLAESMLHLLATAARAGGRQVDADGLGDIYQCALDVAIEVVNRRCAIDSTPTRPPQPQ